MSRKRERDKPYFSRHSSYSSSMPKRRRPLPDPPAAADKPTARPAPPYAVVVMGLPLDCSVLDLKSRFEIYGSISRIRIDRDGVGYITFRNKESADAAIAAGLDPSFGITVNSKKVQVLWATDPLAMWREGIGNNKEKGSMSKLLRPEVPLRRHGRDQRVSRKHFRTADWLDCFDWEQETARSTCCHAVHGYILHGEFLFFHISKVTCLEAWEYVDWSYYENDSWWCSESFPSRFG